MNEHFDGRDLDSFEGMISAEEAALLSRMASMLAAGCIVEIGSWRGKSAIALARGAAANAALKPMVYYVDPHARFTGIYGGEFGPGDRAAFYAAMLRAGCAEAAALINLPSAAAARAWPYKAGLVFIDGDNSQAGVESDVAAWDRHLIEGGFMVFDDALDENAGPAKVIARLLAEGCYKQAGGTGKILALQKTPSPERQRQWATFAEARADISVRAEARGYAPDYALARMSYGTFVSPDRRYMYMETPKAACTSWKQLVVALEGASVDTDASPYHRETRSDMLIHQRKHVSVPTLLDVSPQERRAILEGADDWHVFALCRNPYSRLVSVFENKVRLGEPGYRDLVARFGDEASYRDARAAFSAFVREVAADLDARSKDAHLQPQNQLLLVDLIPYGHIYPVEQMRSAVEGLTAHLRVRGKSAPPALGRVNESAARPWRLYYDEATAALAAQIYADDFARFGYDPTDWCASDGEFMETEHERRLRAEIVARNEMIERLYDLLDAQRLKD